MSDSLPADVDDPWAKYRDYKETLNTNNINTWKMDHIAWFGENELGFAVCLMYAFASIPMMCKGLMECQVSINTLQEECKKNLNR